MTARGVAGALAILWTVLAGARADPGSARPVAIVTEVDGPVQVVARGHTVRPDVADSVEDGAAIVLERAARIVLVYPKAGTIYELRGPGRFVARADAVVSLAGASLLTKRDLIAALRALRIRPESTTLQGSAAMRGASALELQADGPTGSRLGADPMRLCWMPLGPQWLYRIRLIDDDGAVLFEAQTRASAFELPATIPLQPDAAYLWHVLATGPGGRSAEAVGQFRRLDADSEQALLRAESAMPDLDATGRALVRIARRQLGLAPADTSGCLSHGPEQPINGSNSTAAE
ncbi:MAG TPA: hypothetical protein VH183_02580 [Burkholderiaceae bacterium]|jgi:hypothetical protein|nr:hypothetical protein [Burkholderiaceae bacterium]